MDIESHLSDNMGLEVTVWHPENDTVEVTFSTSLIDRDSPFFLIAVPPKLESQLAALMHKGLVVGVMAHGRNPIIFYPRVEHFHESDLKGYWLKIPPDGKYETVQRRAHVRIDMEVPLEIEYGPEFRFRVKGKTLDVSGGGMKLVSGVKFRKDQPLMVRIQFNADEPLLRLPARIVASTDNKWSRSAEDAYSSSCQFLQLTEQQETLIMRQCFRHELARKNR